MDYRRLVKDGKYNPDELKDPFNRGLVKGIQHVLNESMPSFVDNVLDGGGLCDASATMQQIVAEVCTKALGLFYDWLWADYCETVVVLLDEEESEREEAAEREKA